MMWSSLILCILLFQVLYFRNKMALKDSVDAASSGSSKLSFRWDEGRCSTSSSVFSLLSMPLPSKSDWPKYSQSSAVSLQSPLNDNASKLDCSKTESNRGGQWITSDSDCEYNFSLNFEFSQCHEQPLIFMLYFILACSCGVRALNHTRN